MLNLNFMNNNQEEPTASNSKMSKYNELSKLENSRNCLRRIARHDEPQFSKHSIVNIMEKFVKTVNSMNETILVPCRLMDRQVGDSTDDIATPINDTTANQLTMSAHAHGKRNVANSKNVGEFLHSAELFNLYTMLNALKNDLLWTGKDKTVEEEEAAADNLLYSETMRLESTEQTSATPVSGLMRIDSTQSTKADTTENGVTRTAATTTTAVGGVATAAAATATATSAVKGHIRRPSTASVASTVSVSNLSDAESETSQENDSGMESDVNKAQNSAGSSSDSISSSSSDEIHAQKSANDKATELAKRCKRHLNGLYQCLEQMTEAANYLTARYQSDIGGPV